MYFKHGYTRRRQRPPEYRSWMAMKGRCLDPNNASFKKYGEKGVTVCAKWLENFEAFLADVGPRPSIRHSLDRFPNRHGNYEPENVRWATPKEQGINHDAVHLVTINGVTRPLIDICVELKMNLNTMYTRLRHGWSYEEILSTPVNKRFSRKRVLK